VKDNNIIANWVIYKITSPSGRVYVGRTSDVNKRIKQYINGHIKFQRFLYMSIKKYGFETHSFEIIDKFESNNTYAAGKEMFWIRSNMSNFSKWPELRGMNLTDGGEGRIGAKASEETKQKLRDAHKRNPNRKTTLGVKKSIESIMKRKATMMLRTYPKRIYKPVSNETRDKMSLKKIGKLPWNTGTKGVVVPWNKGKKGQQTAWNKGKKFEGTEQERKEKFGKHNIGHTRNRGRKYSNEIIEKMKQRNFKPILQFDLLGNFIAEYISRSEAAIKTGLPGYTITNIANGRIKNPKKYIFKYKTKQTFHKFTFKRRIFKQVNIKYQAV